jgi:hypothetical protein
MKIRLFQSDHGDCLLLTSGNGKQRMLVDGGLRESFSQHVAPTLARLRKAKKAIDVVYVSHIDEDHISGVLQLMDDHVDWRVFDFQKKAKNKKAKPPANPRPPAIKAIWHNAFHELLGDNKGAIEAMLAASSAILAASRKPLAAAALLEQTQLALSKRQALELVNRVGPDQLDIKVNPEFDHKLMLLKNPSPKLSVGKMEFVLLGPAPKDLRKLREEWNDWLRESEDVIADIRRKAKADADRLTSDVDRLLAPLTMQADQFLEFQLALAKKLGQRSEVTTPNLASLMFLAREGTRTVLLTGDGHADDVIAGLNAHQLLDANDALHVEVMKVPHHGSEHNMTRAFAEKITADHYIFCGNGFSENPEIDVIDVIVKERRQALPNRAFKLWFNSSEAVTSDKYKKHMRAVEKRVKEHVTQGGGKVKSRFVSGSFMDL